MDVLCWSAPTAQMKIQAMTGSAIVSRRLARKAVPAAGEEERDRTKVTRYIDTRAAMRTHARTRLSVQGYFFRPVGAAFISD